MSENTNAVYLNAPPQNDHKRVQIRTLDEKMQLLLLSLETISECPHCLSKLRNKNKVLKFDTTRTTTRTPDQTTILNEQQYRSYY